MALDMKKLFGKGMESPKSISIKSISVGKSMDDADDDRVLAAESIIKAVKSNDPEALDLALEEHYRACEESKEDEQSDDSDDSDDIYSESDGGY